MSAQVDGGQVDGGQVDPFAGGRARRAEPSAPPVDGGPAFPVMGGGGQWPEPSTGMTLRDWFAGMALPERICAYETTELDAASAYRYADAMLAARKVGGV